MKLIITEFLLSYMQNTLKWASVQEMVSVVVAISNVVERIVLYRNFCYSNYAEGCCTNYFKSESNLVEGVQLAFLKHSAKSVAKRVCLVHQEAFLSNQTVFLSNQV